MNTKLLIGFLSIFILMSMSCNNKSPTSPDEMKFPKQLTASGNDYIPFISPDGEYIAFLSARNTYDPWVAAIKSELWIMDKNGYDQHPIISIDDLYDGSITITKNVSWSKNSNDILVQIYTPMGSEIWRVTVDGSKNRLSSSDDWAGRPKYSPDGLKIAFIIQGSNPPDGSPVYKLYVSNTDLSEPLLIENGLIQDFVWEINSDGLIYSLYGRANVNYDLWKYSVIRNEKLQFSNTLDSEEDPSCASDGKYIAYSGRNSVYITPSDTFLTKKVLDNARKPNWIPNWNLLLVASEQTLDNQSYWTESWIVDLEGKVIKKIAEGKTTSVNFSSNGEYFVYTLDGNLWVDQMPK